MGVTGRECFHGEGAETGYSSGIKLVITAVKQLIWNQKHCLRTR